MLLHEATPPATALEYFAKLQSLYERIRKDLEAIEPELQDTARMGENGEGVLISWDASDDLTRLLKMSREFDSWWISKGGKT
jgi:hypothetical protein